MAPRQTVVNTQPGLGVSGDFATVNPRFTLLEGAGGAVAGPQGLTIGAFAWATAPMDADGAPATLNNFGSGVPDGFIGREQQGLITTYLADAGMVIPAGFMATCYASGDFFVTNSGTTPAQPKQKVYANFATGQATAAATGSPSGGGTSTASTVAAQTYSVTASILGALMTVTAVGSGTIQPGSAITGTGVLTGTTVTNQVTPLLAGEALGGIGRYNLSSSQPTIASETISGTWGLLTIGGTVTSGYGLNDVLTGGTITAGSTITANASNGIGLTGTGAAGTYATQTQTVASAALNVSAINVETSWTVASYAAPGALMKIRRLP